MNRRIEPPSNGAPRMGVLQKLVASVAGVIFLIGAALIGSLFLIVAFGITAIAATAIGLRLWWFRRQLGKTVRPHGVTPGPARSRGETLEGDFEEIEPEDVRRPGP